VPYPYSIENINARAKSDPIGFACECEAIFNRKVAEVAANIAERTIAANSRVVLLSGPSGSGKTTTAKKICDALMWRGIKAHSISLDKYYLPIDPEISPRASDGQFDRESPLCLDLELINEHFGKLNKGEEVIVPHFSFRYQERDPQREMLLKLGHDELVIFEGIHALNDLLADDHPDAYKLYISARSDIIHDNGDLCFKRTWTRLLRRAVRDNFFRAMGAVKTLEMWGNVREGEKKYISPFKYKADLLFDSSMEYEISVLKHFALDAFSNVPADTKRKEELDELYPALLQFEEIDTSCVLHDSILREFIGGGTYVYD
jgi:uridine kinase